MSVVELHRFTDVACDCCTDVLDVTACPICSLRLCARCWVVHLVERQHSRESSTCDAVFFIAECHAREGDSDGPTADDFAAARTDLASYVRTRRTH